MDRERWLAIKPSLEKALELDTAARRVWLSELAQTSRDVARDVEQLLAFDTGDGDDLLDEPLMIQLPDPGTSWVGRAIGAYHLDRRIGRGGMGSVWLAHTHDEGATTPVAFKVLNRALLGRTGRERFAREGRLLAQLSHPHIARFLDAGVTDDGQPFLVLEYVQGTSIDEFVRHARYTPRQRIALFLEVLDAVAHAHANHIIHRDIKPTNILVREDGVPKLLDFGIAKLLAEGRDLADPSSLSREGGYALTPRYASPEQIRGDPVSIATDVYALGVLLYLLLSGRHPTHAGCTTAAEQIRAVIDVTPIPLSEAIADTRSRESVDIATLCGTSSDELRQIYRGGLDAILARALAKSTHDRYRKLAELSADLRRVLGVDATKDMPIP